MAPLKGLNQVLANLNKEINGIKARTVAGMTELTLSVKRGSVQRTPIDTGNLRGSAFSKVEEEGTKIIGTVGYTAFYALYVHEMPANYNFNQGENKFLEKSLLEHGVKVIPTLQKHARIK